ncbi:MAG: hypothetical protein V4757_17075 [Pseudomonadota bacterium]
MNSPTIEFERQVISRSDDDGNPIGDSLSPVELVGGSMERSESMTACHRLKLPAADGTSAYSA